MNPQLVKSYAEKMSDETGKRVTRKEAEAEITRIVQHVARTLAHSLKFGYHTAEDIEQQGVLYGLQVLKSTRADTGEPAYQVERPLENFLYTHIRNRLLNYRRNNYIRLEPPCTCCPPFSPPAFPCKKWRDWHARNNAKQNLMRPIDMGTVSDEGEARMSNPSTVVQDAITNELETIINTRLPVDLRSDYIRMRNQVMIPKARRQRVREAVASIAREAGYLDEEE